MRSEGWPAGASAAAADANHSPSTARTGRRAWRGGGARWAPAADRLADVVDPSPLFVHAADGLDLAALVHRSGDGNPLVDRRAGQFTENRVQLGGGSGVTLHLVIALLEGEGRGQAQRPFLRISPSEIGAQDIDALGVDAPRQLGLALDVHDAAGADERAGGDTVGAAVGVVAQRMHGQAVDLPHLRPVDIHQQLPALNRLPDALLDPVAAEDLLLQRLLHVPGPHRLTAVLLRPGGALVDQLRHLVEAGAEFFLILGQAGAVFPDAGHGVAVERQPAMHPADRAEAPSR